MNIQEQPVVVHVRRRDNRYTRHKDQCAVIHERSFDAGKKKYHADRHIGALDIFGDIRISLPRMNNEFFDDDSGFC